MKSIILFFAAVFACTLDESCLAACDICINSTCIMGPFGHYSNSQKQTQQYFRHQDSNCEPVVYEISGGSMIEAESTCASLIQSDLGCITTFSMYHEGTTLHTCMFVGIGKTGGITPCANGHVCDKNMKCVECIDDTKCKCSFNKTCA